MNKMDIKPGMLCNINSNNDIYMTYEARPFINAPCVVVKITKAGLILVALVSDKNKTYSFPMRNIDILC